MKRLFRALIALCSIGLLVASAAPQAQAGPMAAEGQTIGVSVAQDAIVWQIDTEYDHVVLTISSPDNVVFTTQFPAGATPNLPVADGSGNSLLDGAYTYELTVVPVGPAFDAQAAENGRQASTAAGGSVVEPVVLSGYFTVSGGAFVLPDQDEPGEGDGVQAAATDDQVILDDLIVDGSICAGFDCVNGESFGFDTLRLKENNLRIKFQDTSTSASFPSNDWQITANDTNNGGANKFSIDDIDGGRTPFTIEAGAPSHSLYVDDGGRIGFGTSTPVVELHLKDGDTPTLRLEQDGSSGFTAQTWDVAGNETNYFIRDATNGSTLPFRIRPGAPTSSIDIAGDGDVGMGTTSPSAPLHIRRTNATAKLLVEEASGTNARRILLELVNNGEVFASVEDSAVGVEWQIGTFSDGKFAFTIPGTGGAELEIHSDGRFIVGPGGADNLVVAPNGNTTVLGSLTVGAGCAGCVAAAGVLGRQSVMTELVKVSVNSWLETVVDKSYDEHGNLIDQREYTRRHYSPVAAAFNETFETGVEGNRIAPLDVATVALAGTQELHTEITRLQNHVSVLQQENSELKSRLAAIEAALGIQGNTGGNNTGGEDNSAQQSRVFLPSVNH